MANIRVPERGKCFCGLIYRDESILRTVIDKLSERFGEIDITAGPIDFTNTSYYCREMGQDLKRRFVSFRDLLILEEIWDWKIFTNTLEEEYLYPGTPCRMINIDPGYMNMARVVLLSAKDFSHRVHLGSGIYAEVTLLCRRDGFQGLPWTYPDYMSAEYISFFRQMRSCLK